MNDPAYKRVLAHARIVKDLVTGCIAPLRPPGWADTLDLASLRPFPTENISDQLRRRLSDVVWQLDRRTGKGAPQTVNLVIEHQSSIDLWLAVLEKRWGVELPSIRKYEEASVVLLEKIDHWEADIREQALEQGIEQGIEQARLEDIRNVLEMRFGAAAAASLAAHLEAAGGGAPRLERLHRLAVQAPDPEAFRRVAENGA